MASTRSAFSHSLIQFALFALCNGQSGLEPCRGHTLTCTHKRRRKHMHTNTRICSDVPHAGTLPSVSPVANANCRPGGQSQEATSCEHRVVVCRHMCLCRTHLVLDSGTLLDSINCFQTGQFAAHYSRMAAKRVRLSRKNALAPLFTLCSRCAVVWTLPR